MRQEVDLLRPELLGRWSWLSARALLAMTVVLGAALLAYGGYLEWRLAAVVAQAERWSVQVRDTEAALQRESAALVPPAPPEALRRELERVEAQYARKQRLLARLEGEATVAAHGFSPILAALARRHPDGLWLEYVALSAGGRQLRLEGVVNGPELLPRFLGALSEDPALSGTQFGVLRLERIDGDAERLRFALAGSTAMSGQRRSDASSVSPQARGAP